MAKSQQENKEKARGRGRTRVFAFLAYPDSAPSDWISRLDDEHVMAYISPLHDKDTNPDGSQKKPHYHVMIVYESVKSVEQVDELRERVLGENYNRGYEHVASMRGYARYLCHLDNPEKAQYDRADVVTLGGGDYDEIIHSAADDLSMMSEIYDFIDEHDIIYYHRLQQYARQERPDWYKLLEKGHIYAVVAYMKSKQAEAKEESKKTDYMMKCGYIPSKMRINEKTGEITESFEEGDQSDEDQD